MNLRDGVIEWANKQNDEGESAVRRFTGSCRIGNFRASRQTLIVRA